MSKRHVNHFEHAFTQAVDIDELLSSYKRALHQIGFRRTKALPKNRWEAAQWLFRHFHDSFVRLRKNSGETPMTSLAATASLSDREQEILRWSAAGLTRLEIGSTIAMSHHTVDFHIRNILRKLDVANMLLAVSKAQHLGLITFEPQRIDVKLKARRERATARRQRALAARRKRLHAPARRRSRRK